MENTEGRIGIKSFTFEELQEYMILIGEKKYRAEQIYKWIYEKRVESFQEMTNLDKNLIEKLESLLYIESLECLNKQESKDGTIKYLLKLPTSDAIETVLMKYKHRLFNMHIFTKGL